MGRGQGRALRPDCLPAEPLRAFLNRKVSEIGVAGVASATGLSPRRVSTLCEGFYFGGQPGARKRYEIKGNTRYLIDRCVSPFGEHPHELYGPDWYAADGGEETDEWYRTWYDGEYHVLRNAAPEEAG